MRISTSTALAGVIALPVAIIADAVELVTGDAVVKPERPSNTRLVIGAMAKADRKSE